MHTFFEKAGTHKVANVFSRTSEQNFIVKTNLTKSLNIMEHVFMKKPQSLQTGFKKQQLIIWLAYDVNVFLFFIFFILFYRHRFWSPKCH